MIFKFSPIKVTKFTWQEIKGINRFIWILIWSALLLTFGFGLITPIFAVFLTQQIQGGSLVVVGVAEMIYLVTKSILQVPISILIDKTSGEKIDFYCIFIGGILITLVPFLYLWVLFPWQIYILQFIYGLGAAFDWPAWMGLFTRHIDENKESFEWSLQTTIEEIGLAGAAVIGGLLADRLGFKPVFLLVGIFSFLTFLFLFIFYQKVKEEIRG
ncbi:MFS transporter [Candidatus Gottesmanbacteria bacterium]|nr:MFS transporter [Candidatus Gottesmanbacteria bacterium]